MEWKKHGLVFSNHQLPSWASSSALTPTPLVLNDQTIRVYAGFRDKNGVSRIGYVDLDAANPKNVLNVSASPALDIGRNGCFDDNGVILGDVFLKDRRFYMYYVGFQLVNKAKFLAFTGLAVSDNGDRFERVQESPVMDRRPGANMIRAIHSAIWEEGVCRAWYAVGDGWQDIKGIRYPKYNIWHAVSDDGVNFRDEVLCVDVEGDEYRIGRPSVYKTANGYLMFYTKGGVSGADYFPGIAYSQNGITWERRDTDFGMALGGNDDFDSLHLCYPRLFSSHNKTWAVYNGNNMGQSGFGLAELIKW